MEEGWDTGDVDNGDGVAGDVSIGDGIAGSVVIFVFYVFNDEVGNYHNLKPSFGLIYHCHAS